MSTDLKTLMSKVSVESGCFRSLRDKEIAREIWDRHSLQTLLESVNLVTKDATTNKNAVEKYVIVLTVLIENCPDGWIKIFVDGFNDSNTLSLCVKSLHSISKLGEAHAFNEHDRAIEGVFDASDFVGIAEKACLMLNLLQTLLKRVGTCGKEFKEVDKWRCSVNIGYFLFTIIVQHRTSKLWTNTCSLALAKDCTLVLLENFGCVSLSDWLVLDRKHVSSVDQDLHYSGTVKKSIIGKLLLQWKPHLQRNTWRQNPAVAWSFSWCLMHLSFPYLSDFIELILPPCLLFVDDHVADNKVMGTSCLIHILKNASSEELRWYGRADVIYEALKLQLYSTEEAVLKLTHEALLLVLKVIVKGRENLAETTKYDEIFTLILQAAFQENKLVLRRTHTHSLHIFIQCLGINVVKYMKRLLELFEEYLEISDAPSEEARFNTLKAVKGLIKTAWPRIPCHSSTIFKILVRLVHQLTSSESSQMENDLLELAVECLKLLKGIDEDFVSRSIQCLEGLPFSDKFHFIMQQIVINK